MGLPNAKGNMVGSGAVSEVLVRKICKFQGPIRGAFGLTAMP